MFNGARAEGALGFQARMRLRAPWRRSSRSSSGSNTALRSAARVCLLCPPVGTLCQNGLRHELQLGVRPRMQECLFQARASVVHAAHKNNPFHFTVELLINKEIC